MKNVFQFIKNNFSNIFLVLILVFFIFTGKFNLLWQKIQAFRGEGNGTQITNFSMVDLKTNQPINLSDLKGNVVLLNFWATWCMPCRIEIPSLIELNNKYKDKKVKIIGISVDQGGKELVKNFIDKEKITYPVTMYDYNSMKIFGDIVAVPTSFLLDSEGKIARKYPGFYMKSSFENEIEKLLQNTN